MGTWGVMGWGHSGVLWGWESREVMGLWSGGGMGANRGLGLWDGGAQRGRGAAGLWAGRMGSLGSIGGLEVMGRSSGGYGEGGGGGTPAP